MKSEETAENNTSTTTDPWHLFEQPEVFFSHHQPPFAVPFDLKKPKLQLSLLETLAATLKQQWNIQVSEYAVEQQKGVVRQNLGPFDPTVNANASYQDRLPNSDGTPTQVTNLGTNLTKTWQTAGTQLSAAFNANRTIEIFPHHFYNPDTTSALTFTITQPLLQGFIDNNNDRLFKASELELKATSYDKLHTICESLLTTANQYWQLACDHELLNIYRISQSMAQQLVSYTQERVKNKQSALSDLFQPEAELSTRKFQVISQLSQITTDIYTLEIDMGMLEDPFNNYFLLLDDFPVKLSELAHQSIDVEGFMKKTPFAQNRYDIQALQTRVKEYAVLIEGMKNQELPQLNIIGNYGINTQQIDQSFAKSMNLTRKSRTNWEIGINFSIPLYRDSAKGQLQQLIAQKIQLDIQVKQAIKTAENKLKSALNTHNILLKSIELTKNAVIEYQNLVKATTMKLKEGLSTQFELIQFQDSLTQAQITYVNTLTSYAQNLVLIKFLSGTLIQEGENDEIIIKKMTELEVDQPYG